jgi:hypothetical protein
MEIKKYQEIENVIKSNNIPSITSHSMSIISKYYSSNDLPIYVIENDKNIYRLDEYSHLFVRYKEPTELFRIYIDPICDKKARELIELKEGIS